MDTLFPINAEVYCSDGHCGHSVQVVIDPAARAVTDLVVAETGIRAEKHLVGIRHVVEVRGDRITLNCTTAELKLLRPFPAREHLTGDVEFIGYDAGEYLLWPTTTPAGIEMETVHFHAALEEQALRKGLGVSATDGVVGRLDDLIVDPVGERITHIVMREGHLWGQKTVTIPVNQIASIGEDGVMLSLTKAEVGGYCDMPAKDQSAPPMPPMPPAPPDDTPKIPPAAWIGLNDKERE